MNKDDDESQTLFLTHQGLRNIRQLNLDNDFTFKIGKKSYKCNRILASFISPTISQILTTDPLCDTFTIDVEDEQNFFENIMNLINGEIVEINTSNYYIMQLFASRLGNQEMEEDLSSMSLSGSHITFHNSIRRYISKSSIGINSENEIRYIASHFSEYQRSELNKLSDDDLELILSQPNLKIEDETWLFNFLINRDQPSPNLFSHLYFEYLTENDIERFIDFLKEEEMTGALWSAISKRLILHVEAPLDMNSRHVGKIEKNDEDFDNMTINFSEEFPFEGIISYFTDKYGGNVSKTKTIPIFASGTLWNSPNVVADFDTTDFWVSENSPDSWIAFDFNEHLINLTAYTIRCDNTGSLRSWVIEGSNDNDQWDEIDRHDDSDDLSGLYSTKTYHVTTSLKFRYLRLRQTGPDINNENYLTLCCIEFFGSLSSNENF